jgi:uncharacterized membrane protein
MGDERTGIPNAAAGVWRLFMHYGIHAVHTVWMALAWIAGSGLVFACMLLFFDAVYGRGETRPEEILKRRYAAGEIDTQEYEQRLSELNKTKPAA